MSAQSSEAARWRNFRVQLVVRVIHSGAQDIEEINHTNSMV